MKSKKTALLLAAVSALATMALFASAAQARTPAPGYEQFAGCPSPEENAEIIACDKAVITGGHLQMGSKDVPIENPITISGGLNEEGTLFFTSKGGLPPVKEKVPGGVIGLTGLTWLLEFLGSEALTLYAATELAGTATVPTIEEPNFPIKVHLINSVLGNHCYIGSNSNPIQLHLITGTTSPPPPNEPITGHPAEEFKFEPEREIVELNKIEYVDNSFSAPGANGCVLTLFGFIPISINGLVNSESGLPAAAGTNETRQNTNIEVAFPENVYP